MHFLFIVALTLYLPISNGFLTVPKCLISTGARIKDLDNLATGNSLPESSRCFVKCVGEESGLIRNGILHSEHFDAFPMVSRLKGDVLVDVRRCMESVQGIKIESCKDVDNLNDCMKIAYRQKYSDPK
uniref:Odorant binding protein 27 n=1 Tax=Dendroctonus adjunctus TaxID=77157 RepID=A0A7U3U816_9CUCU|nr:Odorant binding protein 27 [Dendroctonus adjunctus]